MDRYNGDSTASASHAPLLLLDDVGSNKKTARARCSSSACRVGCGSCGSAFMAFVSSHGKLVARCIGLFVLLGGCISSAVVLGVKRDALPAMLRWVHEHRVGGMFIYGLIYICEFVVVCVFGFGWQAEEWQRSVAA